MNETPADTPPHARPAGRRARLVAAAVVLAVAAAGGIGWRLAVHAHADDPPAPVPLQFSAAEVTRPVRAAMPQRVEFSGPLVAPRTAVVRAKAAGTLLALDVSEGSRVAAGQVLGRIDLSDLQSRLSERHAMVESAEAALAEARRQHEANQRLAEQNFIAPTALHSSQARLDAARAQLKSAQAQLAGSAIGMRDAALLAPIAGIVGKRHVLPGEKLAPEQNLVTIVDLSTLELAGNVGTHEVSLLRPGQAVSVRAEGLANPVEGKLDRIAPQAEAGTRAIGVVVVLPNADERLRAGQYASALVRIEDAHQRLTLPIAALGQTSGQELVWTIERGVLVRRLVVTGRRDTESGRVEILQGLDDGAVVLAAHFDNLKEGAPARHVDAPAGLEPAAAARASPPKS